MLTPMTIGYLASAYQTVRNALELLYFLAGIILVYAAMKALRQIRVGLEQLKLTKDIANVTIKREAFKTAHEQCKMYANEIIPSMHKLRLERETSPSALTNPWLFNIKDGEFESNNFNYALIAAEIQKFVNIDILNSIEAFAMFFVDGIADEQVGYRETARSYCVNVKYLMPAFWFCRVAKCGDFKSTIRLYEIWDARLKVDEMQKEKDRLDHGIRMAATPQILPVGLEQETPKPRTITNGSAG